MNKLKIKMPVEKFLIEHARSGGSRCKRCHSAIARRALRIARLIPTRKGFVVVWYHVPCLYALSTRPRELCEIVGIRMVGDRAFSEIAALTYAGGRENPDKSKATSGVDYSPHYKCECGVCGEGIRKAELRFWTLIPYERPRHFLGDDVKYFHAECFFAKYPDEKRRLQDFMGFRQLLDKDMAFIKDLMGGPPRSHRLVPPWERLGK